MSLVKHTVNKTKLWLGKSLPPNSLRSRYQFETNASILIPELKIVYTPIPKAANRSIKHALAETMQIKYQLSSHKANWQFIDVNQLPYEDYFHFTVVRNPIERLQSCYLQKFHHPHRRPNRIFWKYGRAIRTNMSFQDFVEFVIQTPDQYSDRHFKSQYLLLGQDISTYDNIIKIENIEDEWRKLRSKFNLPSLTHQNKAIKQNAKLILKDNLVSKLHLRYKEDYNILGYKR